MCESPAVARRLCTVDASAARALLSPAAPILLLLKSPAPLTRLDDMVAPGNSRLGVMLPYTPLHTTLLDRLRQLTGRPAVLVMTSANRKDDPNITDDAELARQLPTEPDLILTHDRPIANPCDDSVIQLDQHPGQTNPERPASRTALPGSTRPGTTIIRRARGFAPQLVGRARRVMVRDLPRRA
jgi:hydrogenase maturation factor HypF (carbamoyltransferase family)